ncbi:MAG: hypothetical protein K6360_06830 [Deltaproteobacteria bacterium]
MANYFFDVLLDEGRLKAIKDAGLADHVKNRFAGELKLVEVSVSEDTKNKVLNEFDTARTDSRNAITDVPVAFMRELYHQVIAKKSLGDDAVLAVLEKVAEIKDLASKESEYLPAPEIA